ncbi:4-alpha-glucanotransferase [Sulfuricella denitrificans]|nr:4-alpha-glucanotransferase [Sulfuricella denitrificans]
MNHTLKELQMLDSPGTASLPPAIDPDLAEALRLLDKSDFLLAVHDASFPGVEGEDTGRGSPYGEGGMALARFARALGFTGLQLGPQGQTSPVNHSPYDGTIFSRSIFSLDLKALARNSEWGGLLGEDAWLEMVAGNPRPDGNRVACAYTFDAYAKAVEDIHQRFDAARQRCEPAALRLDVALAAFWQENHWLRDDALYEALSLEHNRLPWRQWPQEGERAQDRVLPASTTADSEKRRRMLEQRHGGLLERYALVQLILLEQHRTFRGQMQALGLKIYGDVQVGLSLRDAWSRQALLLGGYVMGAPPSRTNINGQPWNYPVLDPAHFLSPGGEPGPALVFVAERLGKMLAEFDGLRLDHPHGLVCPWVYRADDPDPYHALQRGARLFSSQDDHPDLAHHAIVHPDQLNRERPAYADDWVRELTPEHESRYAVLMDTLMEQVHAHGRRKEDILCEVLSTETLPLRQVRLRHGLGRFRVTQKADLDDPTDVYRSENAEHQDWVMVGNHDTPSIWRLTKDWQGREEGCKQAAYLARRLRPDAPELLASALASDYRKLAHAKVADLFLSPARHVMLFFADLFGLEETYNVPGTVNEDNWTLRVPTDFARRYEDDRRRGEALNLHAVLALALRSRPEIARARPELIARLEARAGWRID